jgi:hypothetical protein
LQLLHAPLLLCQPSPTCLVTVSLQTVTLHRPVSASLLLDGASFLRSVLIIPFANPISDVPIVHIHVPVSQ